MQSENRLTPPEHELELTLRGLQPAAASIDRDRLMFHAGQASARRRNRPWQGATILLAAACIVSLAVRPSPREIQHVNALVEQSETPNQQIWASMQPPGWRRDQRLAEASYLKLRQAVLTRGLDALAVSAGSSAPDTEPAEAIEQLLDLPPGAIKHPGLLGTRTFRNQGESL